MVVVGWEGLNFWFGFWFCSSSCVFLLFVLSFAGKLITQYSPRSSRPEKNNGVRKRLSEKVQEEKRTYRLSGVEEDLVDGVGAVHVAGRAGVLAHVLEGGVADQQVAGGEDGVLAGQ